MGIGEYIDAVIETDVLVVGGSGAGVSAAIAAIRSGVEVILVSKGKVGYSGNAIMAGGGFSIAGESAYKVCGEKKAKPSDNKEKLFENIVKESYFLSDQNMVEQYVYESPSIVNELLRWGERAGQEFVFVPPNTWISAGICWGRALKQGLKENPGIDVIEDTTVVEILKSNKKVSGAVGIDIYTGKIILFKAKAIILATGGYQPFSFKNTVSDMTGDGVAMAFRVGATLADMEFLLPLPTAIIPNEIRGSIFPYVFEFNAKNLKIKARDVNGNLIEIPEKIKEISKGTKLNKLASMYYWGKTIFEGKGGPNGGIYLDYSDNTKEELEKAFDDFFTFFSKWHRYGYYKGDNMKQVRKIITNSKLFEVGLGFEYSMGGILVDEKMQTNFSGLFAAGEVASGVFGACRVRDGLTEMLAQGYRAGLTASEYVKGEYEPRIDRDMLYKAIQKILQPFETKKGISPLKVFKEIETTADSGFGLVRNEKGLSDALKKIQNIKNEAIPKVTLKNHSRNYNYEWISALQAENLALCVEAGVRCALLRKESRGCHIRSDYPEVDHNKWTVRILVSQNNNSIKLSTRKPIVTKLSLPKGKDKSVMDYFLNKDLRYKT